MSANAKNGVSGAMYYTVAGKNVIAQGTLTVINAVEAYTAILSGLPEIFGGNDYVVNSTGGEINAFYIRADGTIISRYALNAESVLRLSCSYLTN